MSENKAPFEAATKPEQRHSAFAFLFMRPKDGSPPVFILTKRRKDRKFGTPGGGFEAKEGDKTVLDTIIRELREEINLCNINANDLFFLGKESFTKHNKPHTLYNTTHYGYELSEAQFKHIFLKWNEAKCADETRKLYAVPIVDPEPGTLINMLLSIHEKTHPCLRDQIIEALEQYKFLPPEQIQKIRNMNWTSAPIKNGPEPTAD